MSLTTESSLQRSGPKRWKCICPCFSRKVAPVNPQPTDADFMALGKKKKRVICVFHIDPYVTNHSTNESLAPFARKVQLDEDGYQSDSSDNEYWFTKWSKPLRTVRKFQNDHLRKQNNLGAIKSHLPTSTSNIPSADGDSKTTSTLTVQQSSQISQRASQEGVPIALQDSAGVVNPAFDESPTDPEAKTTTLKQTKTASKPLLYFIHGAGESSETWKKMMYFFADLQYEVLALDLLGHGFSQTPQKEKCYTFKKLLGDVVNVFDAHVSNGRKCVIIGHGYGCSFAVALSRQRSSNVSLLALLSSGGPTPLAPPIHWRREWKLPASLLRCLRNVLPCGMRRNVFYGPRGKSCLHDSAHFQSLPGYIRHHLAVGQAWPEGDVAFHRKVAVPTLLVHGLKDRFVSLVEMCEMERTIPRAFLEVIPESGHDIQADAPDQLNKMLRKFVEHWQR